jgi:uncharacterized membrane protein SpoIIM required for sporulation
MTTAAEFISKRQLDWQELERLLETIQHNKTSLSYLPSDLSRFAALFRSLCSDLSRARSLDFPEELIDYLNALAARSHNVFYTAPPPKPRLAHFFFSVLPRLVRRNASYLVAALILFYGSLVGMVALSHIDDRIMYQFLPPNLLKNFEKMYEQGVAGGRNELEDLSMTGFYIKNNIGIAFQCFASGIFFGMGSIVVLITNGLMIGAVVGFISHTPAAMNLLSFIIGHGPFELTAICLSGAAGLRLGLGPILTGNRRRIDSLRQAANEAVRLIVGAATLLLAAALIEGFFSSSFLPIPIKFAFGGGCISFLVWYFGFCGKTKHFAPKHSSGEVFEA